MVYFYHPNLCLIIAGRSGNDLYQTEVCVSVSVSVSVCLCVHYLLVVDTS